MSDRRKDTRANEENKVIIEFISTAGGFINQKEAYALTKDISVGGAKIVTDRFFPVGTFFRVNLSLSKSKQTLSLEARVKWTRNVYGEDLYETGVEFLHEIPETMFTLLKHIFSLTKGIPTIVRSEELRM